MRISIIAHPDRIDQCRDARDILGVLGHKVISTWIDHGDVTESQPAYLATQLGEIPEAEAVLVFTGGPFGAGLRVFLAGWAYGTGRLIYVCGPPELWTKIPDVAEHHYRTWGELVLALAAEAAKRPASTFEVDGNGGVADA